MAELIRTIGEPHLGDVVAQQQTHVCGDFGPELFSLRFLPVLSLLCEGSIVEFGKPFARREDSRLLRRGSLCGAGTGREGRIHLR